MTVTVRDICRYPVKGLSADRLERVALSPGAGLPFDRRWAIAHAASRIDRAAPGWSKKQDFLTLSRDEKMGQLGARFDEETKTLTITRKGKPVSRGRLDDPTGRMLLQTFLAGFMPPGPRGNPRIVEAPASVHFTDQAEPFVSLINLASVADIERVARRPVNPLRFRGNLYLEGAPAWSEAEWPGRRLRVGAAVLEAVEVIDRCAATNVDPDTGESDMNVPLTLRKGFGHVDCGVYARVVEGGTVAAGDAVELL